VVVIGIVAGFVLWTVIWLGGNALLRSQGLLPPDGEPVSAARSLLILVVLSAAASVAAGLLTQRLGGSTSTIVLAVALLVVGAAVQFQFRALMPAWYHVVFLALIVPATLLGRVLDR
jgi:hypothetical protein